EAEELASRQDAEDDPQGMEPDAVAYQARREHVVGEELPREEDAEYHRHHRPPGPELVERDAHRRDESEDGADVRDERHGACREADEESEVEPDHRQRGGIEEPEHEADDGGAAGEAREYVIDRTRLGANGLGVVKRPPAVDLREKAWPIAQTVKGDEWRDREQQRHVDEGEPVAEQPARKGRHRPDDAL